MRPLNFVLIFVFCLALIVFGIENTQPATIQFIEGIQVQAPLCIELFLAMGIGATLAWMFGIWSRLQGLLASRQERSQMRRQDTRIQELEQDIARYQAELVKAQHQLPPASESLVTHSTLDSDGSLTKVATQ
jgi:uncharacterized integral membrane protein